MKYFRKIRRSLLILSVMILAVGQGVFAADDEPYPYTVRLLPGNQGVLTGVGVEAPGADVNPVKDAAGNVTAVEIKVMSDRTDVRVNIYATEAANEKDSRYFVRGVKRAGRDNSEEEPSFTVDCDKEYVISYGVKGDTVRYTVNYVDAAGNVLLEGGSYYGNAGERQYVSARYVDGYQPDAYNKVMTLKNNEAENVFNFVYTPVATPTDETGTATATPATPAAPAAAAAPGAAAEGAAAPGAAATPEGEEAVAVEEPEVPEDLVDLDDEDTPLANQKLDEERPGTRMGYTPVYVGIAAAAAAALILAAVYLKKRRSSPIQNGDLPKVLEHTDISDSKDDE